MPAALTVDQSLVDAYLSRVDRFYNNVEQFSQTLKDMAASFKERFVPAETVMEEPVYQETSAAQYEEPAAASQITADDIDLDALLAGIDLGSGMSM